MKAYKSKKHPFLLFELLIALTLIAICAPLLFYFPNASLRTELKTLEVIECERIADNTFQETLKTIYSHELLLPLNKKKPLHVTLSTSEIKIGNLLTKKVTREYSIIPKKQKEGVKVLFEITISLKITGHEKPLLFQHNLFATYPPSTPKIEARKNDII